MPPFTHLDNRIRGVTGTIPRAVERRTGRRDVGTGRSDPRIPLTLPWQAGARRCRAGIMRLLLRPPTDLRGSPCGMRPSGGRRYRRGYVADGAVRSL